MRKLFKLAVMAAIVAVVIQALRKLLEEEDYPLPIPDQDRAAGSYQFDESELGGEVSHELLDILVCPLDKGPLQMAADSKWLINPRNGYRYPIRNGIPVMLIEEGQKHRDESLIEA